MAMPFANQGQHQPADWLTARRRRFENPFATGRACFGGYQPIRQRLTDLLSDV
jgi:hypothetical protein